MAEKETPKTKQSEENQIVLSIKEEPLQQWVKRKLISLLCA
jgi:hypothetical protein